MDRKPSIATITSFKVSVVALVAIIVLVGVWTYDQYEAMQHEVALLKRAHIEEQKLFLSEVLSDTAAYIEQTKNAAESKTKADLKNRVDEAFAITQNIYDKLNGHVSQEILERAIKEALRPIRYYEERGFYFAFTLNGDIKLAPAGPGFEGENAHDTNSQIAGGVSQAIEMVREYGEGIIEHT